MIAPQIAPVLFARRKVNALLVESARVLRRATDE
jgi:hypothetical protein